MQFLLGLVGATLLIEGALRVTELPPLWRFLPIATYLPTEPDPHIAFAHIPGSAGFWTNENRAHVRFNNFGLHDRDRAERAPEGGFRVAVLGDSMVEALQVDHTMTFTALAEAMLDGGIEVINLGLANAYQAVQIERWRQIGAKLNVDALVVVLSAVYDEGYATVPTYRDDTVLPAYRQNNDGTWYISTAFTTSADYAFFSSDRGRMLVSALEHSRVARLIFNRWKGHFWQEWGQSSSEDARSSAACRDIAFDAQWRLWVEHQPELADGRLDAYLSDIAAIGAAEGIPVTLLLLGPTYDCPYSVEKADEFEAAARTRVRGYGLDVLFAATEMRWRAPEAELRSFFGFGDDVGNGHLNPTGHRIMAEILVDLVRALPGAGRPDAARKQQ